MSKGCCLGCIGFAAVGALAIGIALFLMHRAFDVFTVAQRVALDDVYGIDHPVVARLDLSSDYLKDVTGRAVQSPGWVVDLFWPHEALLFADVDLETNTREMTMAVSTRRFGSILSLNFPVPMDHDIGGGYIVKDWGLENNGVFTMQMAGPIDEATRLAVDDWSTDVEPYALARGHLFELVVDNSQGWGYATLNSLFAVEDETPEAGDRLTAAEMDELLRIVGAYRLEADIAPTGAVEVSTFARCGSSDAAETAFSYFNALLEEWKVKLDKDNAHLEGEFTLEGNEVIGKFVVTDVDEVMVESSQKKLEEMEKQSQP